MFLKAVRLHSRAVRKVDDARKRMTCGVAGRGSRLYKAKELVFSPATKRLEAFGTKRADFSCAELEVMRATSYTIKERLLPRL